MDIASELTLLAACKLIIYTFGALVNLFLMVLIVGRRRLGRLEWLLFALMAALFMWNSGNLLALNVALSYGMGPTPQARIARLIPLIGLLLSPPLLVHTHTEYAFPWRAGGGRARLSPFPKSLLIAVFYVPLIATPWLVRATWSHPGAGPAASLGAFARPLVIWAVLALLVAAAFNLRLRQVSADRRMAQFHGWLSALQLILAGGLAWSYLLRPLPSSGLGGYFPTLLMAVAVVPSVLMGYWILRFNFLDLRVQRNLIYSVAAIFALLIYIDFIRRLSGYLDEHVILPAAVTEAILIFILVIFLEPVRKAIDRALQAAFESEFSRVQKLSAEIQDYAKRSGDIHGLQRFIEEKAPRALGLERVKLIMGRVHISVQTPSEPPRVRIVPIRRGEDVIGLLAVTPLQADISGDLVAALQLLADQLVAAIELCQLIADKVQLERALAEKAKMAFLGEMAARIAHNVKNPLSSMKTLVQLLEEDATLPERVRQDCRMVVGEIDRLNANISQVLRYAKPARDIDRAVNLCAVVDRVVALARAEAERREVKLEFAPPDSLLVEGGEEAASDIVSNLVVNALEASPPESTVRVRLARADHAGGASATSDPSVSAQQRTAAPLVELMVEDQGPGIARDLKEKIFQPFFTTRAGGTGLGLAIVARRVEEIAGNVECHSPIEDGKGSRFVVRFRAASA